jgi:hypothetical protein
MRREKRGERRGKREEGREEKEDKKIRINIKEIREGGEGIMGTPNLSALCFLFSSLENSCPSEDIF